VTAEPQGDDVLEAVAEVIERQGRVARAESALLTARRRLGDSLGRLTRIATDKGVELPPLAALAVKLAPELPPVSPGEEERPGTLRARIVAAMEANPAEVFTPARFAPVVSSPNRDSIRNTLLVLAAKGRVVKVGAAQYQARREEGSP
jgi:hypothetical protein